MFKTVQNFMVFNSIENNAQEDETLACYRLFLSSRASRNRDDLSQLTPLTHGIKRILGHAAFSFFTVILFFRY